jgi:hypothetical protein
LEEGVEEEKLGVDEEAEEMEEDACPCRACWGGLFVVEEDVGGSSSAEEASLEASLSSPLLLPSLSLP